MSATDSPHHRRTLARGFAILELVASAADGITVTEVAARTGMDKSTASRLVSSLEELGYIYRQDDRTVVLTGKVLTLARGHSEQFDIRRVARPLLRRLRDETNETVYLSVRQGLHMLYADQFDPVRQVVVAPQVGKIVPLHGTAMGRAVLFALPRDQHPALLRELEPLPVESPELAMTLADVEREMRIAAKNGFVTIERTDDLARVGAEIRNSVGAPVAAVGVYGPAYRTAPRLDKIGRACRVIADEISTLISGARPGHTPAPTEGVTARPV